MDQRSVRRAKVTNRILQTLSRDSFDRLVNDLRHVDLAHGRVVARAGDTVTEVFFIDSGLVSLVQQMVDGRVVEVAAIGPEGVSAPFSLCGLDRVSIEQIVQVPVSAFAIPREAVVAELNRSEAARQLIQHYARYLIGQIAQVSACNRLHTLKQRICRWLLLAHDCARADRFYLTHEFLAEMLGVHRSALSAIAADLKAAGLIEYRHGHIRILDRKRLNSVSCECYLETRNAQETVFAR